MRRDPARAVKLLDLMLEFFGEDGHRWARGWHDPRTGARCLVGAMNHLRSRHRICRDGAGRYLDDALPARWRGLIKFNDEHEGGWFEVLMVLAKARQLALCELSGTPKPVKAHQPRREASLRARIDLLSQIYEDRCSPRVRWITKDTYILCPNEPVEALPMAA